MARLDHCDEPGLQIIAHMPGSELMATTQMAEELGYHYVLLADEEFMPAVYMSLGIVTGGMNASNWAGLSTDSEIQAHSFSMEND